MADGPRQMTDDELLRERFGFSEFRPGQREVLGALAEHGAALGVFPTGAGKSLCYQLPALRLDGVTLVVSPLVALMKDRMDSLRRRQIERPDWIHRWRRPRSRTSTSASPRGP